MSFLSLNSTKKPSKSGKLSDGFDLEIAINFYFTMYFPASSTVTVGTALLFSKAS
ncbi:hypothetical protein LV89_02203 [Arcicella aurantiaca]|uniref:Uncharacterized protein n=1 Tax=Arcicella aurantiaca TaxID=591202 RepID=A0A316EU26_9BACT|nr:hypothetical protein LV89_02203 [Arcicella aurantiaca]